jgi:hypothetical protein
MLSRRHRAQETASFVAQFGIYQLNVRYAQAMDTGNWAELRDCFTDDAKIAIERVEGDPFSYDEYEAFAKNATANLRYVQHVVTNLDYELAGDTASGRCSFVNPCLRDSGEPLLFGGFYFDNVALADGVWRFTSRKICSRFRAVLAELPEG